MTLSNIHDGPADEAQSFKLINRGYAPDVYSAGQYFETCEDMYDHMLNCMPPKFFDGNAFMMSEASTGNLAEVYVRIDGRYYCITCENTSQLVMNRTLHALRSEVGD